MHQPKFHCFVQRSYRNASIAEGKETTTIAVVRIFCDKNYLARKLTGEPKQYTLTLLPGFLIPYSVIPIVPVHDAIDAYIMKGNLTQIGAALRMRCLSAASFRMFYRRVCKRVNQWTALFLALVAALGGNIKEAAMGTKSSRKVAAQWAWFVFLASEYVRVYSRYPATEVITDQFLWQHIYAVLGSRRMGLGP